MDADFVIVGSGFGGAIAALRLAEAGKRVLVLERGRHWAPADFPRDPRDVASAFWHRAGGERSQGLFDVRFFSDVGVVAAAGVGGGSLVYANVHIRPDASVFDAWPKPFSRSMLDPCYDRVAAALDVAPAPESLDLPKRAWFRAVAAQLGFECFDPDQAVAWNDPHQDGRGACELCARCEFGCVRGAKNTLDFNYLRDAQRLGATVAAGIDVSHVAPADGGYVVHAREADGGAAVSFSAPRVVLCAGTLGTNEILLRSRDVNGTLPNLPASLGLGFSVNGDFFGILQAVEASVQGWRGTDVTSVMRCEQGAERFTLAAPVFNQPSCDVLASLGLPRAMPAGATSWRDLAASLRKALGAGAFDQPLATPPPEAADPAHFANLFAIGRDNAGGRIVLDGGKLDVRWSYAEENAALVAAMDAAMQRIAQASGARYSPIPTWTVFRRPITVHPLGGCRLSRSPDGGVVDVRGEVHGHPGLYVADGSVIPSAIGFHPAMTIAAVAEHVAGGLQQV